MNWAGDWIQDNISVHDIVLDLGCGIMQATLDHVKSYPKTKLICKRLIGVDIYQPYLDFLNERGIETVQWDLTKIPYPFEDKSVDVTILTDIFEHLKTIEEVDALISESIRITKKKLFMVTPREFFSNISTVENPPTPYDKLGGNEYQQHHILIGREYLEEKGFEVLRKSVHYYGIRNINNKSIWNERYSNRKVKSRNVFNKTIRWIWQIINHYAEQDIEKGCIDVGCGDHSFWKYFLWWYRSCDNYIGIDISDVQTKDNAKRFQKDERKIFVAGNSAILLRGLKRKVVLCIDLLFHVLDDDEYEKTIINLCEYSEKWIILTNWHKDPINYNREYQKYRNFNDYQHIFTDYGFELLKTFKVPSNDIGSIYIYKKVNKVFLKQ